MKPPARRRRTRTSRELARNYRAAVRATTQTTTKPEQENAVAQIRAVFAVNASHVIDFTADVDALSPTEIADLSYENDPGISICHQCAHEIDDPESGDLAGFSVDDIEYTQVDGEWVTTP